MKRENPELIMIVDDFEDSRDMYAQYLSYEGFRVALAADGQQAIDKAIELQPDVVVMDLSLPVVSGWEATRRLKEDERTKHIAVLVLTAHAFKGAAAAALQAGCDGYVTKPCPPDELVAEILKVLEQKRVSPKQDSAGAA